MRILRIGISVLAVICIALAVWFGYRESKTKTPPVLTCRHDIIEAPVDVTDERLLDYVVATDDKDGDISDKIVIQRKTYFVEKGTTLVTFSVADSDNNVAKLTKKLKFTNYEAPKIQLKTDLIIHHGDSSDISKCFTATDVHDGDITSRLKLISADYSYLINGSYDVNCKVSNSFGDTRDITIKAIVTDKEYKNARILLSDYLVYAKSLSEIDPMSYVTEVSNADGYNFGLEDVVVRDAEKTADNVYNIFYAVMNGDKVETVTRLIVVIAED